MARPYDNGLEEYRELERAVELLLRNTERRLEVDLLVNCSRVRISICWDVTSRVGILALSSDVREPFKNN